MHSLGLPSNTRRCWAGDSEEDAEWAVALAELPHHVGQSNLTNHLHGARGSHGSSGEDLGLESAVSDTSPCIQAPLMTMPTAGPGSCPLCHNSPQVIVGQASPLPGLTWLVCKKQVMMPPPAFSRLAEGEATSKSARYTVGA